MVARMSSTRFFTEETPGNTRIRDPASFCQSLLELGVWHVASLLATR
jgi:hypothetical protein